MLVVAANLLDNWVNGTQRLYRSGHSSDIDTTDDLNTQLLGLDGCRWCENESPGLTTGKQTKMNNLKLTGS